MNTVAVVLRVALLFTLPWMTGAASTPPAIQFTRFASADAFASGALSGVVVDGGNLVLAPNEVSGTWQSPVVTPGFAFTRLVASWNADTPGDGRLRVEAQATTAAGATSDWYVLGIWAADDHAVPGRR